MDGPEVVRKLDKPFSGATINCELQYQYDVAIENFKEKYCKCGDVLHTGPTTFKDDSYEVTLDGGQLALKKTGESSRDFKDMLEKRQTSENVIKRGICPSVGTSFVMILDVYNGEEHVGKFMVLTTREKAQGLWGAAISGYVNTANPDKENNESPISNTMMNEVHEEVIPITPEGKWVHFHFEGQDDENVRVFTNDYNYSDGRIEIMKHELPSWLTCSNCNVENGEMNIFVDPHHNNGQVVDCGIARIDLKDKLSLIHSESAFNATKNVIEERLNENGIILMKLDDNLNPTGDFCRLEVGELVSVEAPKFLSELFSLEEGETNINEETVAITVAGKEEVEAEYFLSRFRQASSAKNLPN